MLKWLLAWFPQACTILEAGCGTGHFTRWFGTLGFHAIGIDLSQPMLDSASRLEGAHYVQGDALRMPFISKSVDLVAMITTLEFLSDPIMALHEALRLARQGLILGVLNADSRLGRAYQRTGGSVWEAAHLFSLAELKHIILKIIGDRARVVWRTTLWDFWPFALPLPWGGFIGMAVRIQEK